MPRFYDRRAWRRCSAAYLSAHPLCEMCEQHGKLTPATQVDHIVPLGAGGAGYLWDGLQALCDRCHCVKTHVLDAGKPLSGVAVDGSPLDPTHPWNLHNKEVSC